MGKIIERWKKQLHKARMWKLQRRRERQEIRRKKRERSHQRRMEKLRAKRGFFIKKQENRLKFGFYGTKRKGIEQRNRTKRRRIKFKDRRSQAKWGAFKVAYANGIDPRSNLARSVLGGMTNLAGAIGGSVIGAKTIGQLAKLNRKTPNKTEVTTGIRQTGKKRETKNKDTTEESLNKILKNPVVLIIGIVLLIAIIFKK